MLTAGPSRRVCHHWKRLVDDRCLWRHVDLTLYTVRCGLPAGRGTPGPAGGPAEVCSPAVWGWLVPSLSCCFVALGLSFPIQEMEIDRDTETLGPVRSPTPPVRRSLRNYVVRPPGSKKQNNILKNYLPGLL